MTQVHVHLAPKGDVWQAYLHLGQAGALPLGLGQACRSVLREHLPTQVMSDHLGIRKEGIPVDVVRMMMRVDQVPNALRSQLALNKGDHFSGFARIGHGINNQGTLAREEHRARDLRVQITDKDKDILGDSIASQRDAFFHNTWSPEYHCCRRMSRKAGKLAAMH